MSYEWYNNGKRNKKIYDDRIPKGYVKGYMLRNDKKIKRVRKLIERADLKVKTKEAYYKQKLEEYRARIERELVAAQKAIIDF